ncbi:NAD-dependent epimerase/dehydratase family protein [Micromonospora sp. ALFpr18c]|uniref:NAD-dependent epimerase/dehydratase family protein n=1 Tax=Micromonospora sp. ALFpr18c TaxID=1458665 RepID=UPI00124B03E2|nr:NAD-dependent epimerase/dehydratase family protein [Micromonospora sp. ALFpr18c]KAB1934756.1 NAD-dependent epimerase/dehydratase family protein [Micromonospora sp. ALFpr18c]
MTTAVVLLGASGRLGRQLVPLLSAAGIDTIAVARSPGIGKPSAAEWISADLTNCTDQTRVVNAVGLRCGGPKRVAVIDLVLDRSGVEGMRRSVRAATDTVLRLRDRLRECAAQPHLVAASTTAVLAPGLYQTPYGLAKRRQVITYASAGLPGVALLLPVLRKGEEEAASPCWPLWSYDHAAHQLHVAASAPLSSRFVVQVPSFVGDHPAMSDGRGGAATPSVLMAHLRCLLTERDSMQAHRSAARGRLRWSPARIRRRVDHHLAPAELVRRFADRYHVTVLRDRDVHRPDGGGLPPHA